MDFEIGNIAQIPPGEGRNFTVGEAAHGLRVAVFHTRDGNVFATQPDCPHKSGPLADGLIDNHSVVCPLHDRAYAFADGAGLGNECAIRVYKIRLEAAGKLVLAIEPAQASLMSG